MKEAVEDKIALEEEGEERIWIPYEELKAYLDHVTVALMNVVSSIETSLATIEKNAKNKGESNE